jgi:hypothetical protein
VDVRIGVQQTARELSLELADTTDRAALKAEIAKQIAEPAGVLWITDAKGREVCVPAAKVAYVELGANEAERRIGFGG